jgi:molecular chaperone GrpE
MPKAETSKKPTNKGLEDKKIADLTEALQQERADAINLRRRHEQEIASLRNRIKANVVRDLLPTIDNLERSIKYIPEDIKDHAYAKGVQSVLNSFYKTLKDMGVNRIDTVGQAFDPKLHEAVSLEEGGGKQEIVSEELQAGYTVGEEVIRHAMVKVKMQ